MPIPHQLAAEMAAASDLITVDGELPAAVRKRIFQLIEELSVVDHVSAGYLRRARLAIICANEVLQRISPYPDVLASARAMLRDGVAALSGRYDLQVLQKKNGEFHTRVIDLFQFGEIAFVPVYAGMACFSAINTILFDSNFDVVGENEKSVPPDDWDVSFYAALAVSGGATWEARGCIAHRRSHWQWYLDKAIPLAWDVDVTLELA